MVRSWLPFFLYWILAWIVFFTSFYIPGRVVLKRFKNLKGLESLVLSVFLGIALWGLVGYFLGYINLRFLTYFYLATFWLIWLRDYKREIKFLKKTLREIFSDRILVLIIILGVPVAISTVFTSGLPGKDGTGFFGINPIDGSYHIALIKSLIRAIPPEEPGMANALVQNYHYWSDLVLSEIIRIYKLPVINLFYHYFPVFLAIFYALAGYQLGITLTKNRNVARLISFFLIFSGNLGYLVMLLLTGRLTFTVASLDNATLLFTNPPRILAQAMFLAGVVAVSIWLKTKKLGWGIVVSILLGVCVGIKIYVGIFASLGLAVLFFIFLYKKEFKMLIPIVVAAILNLLIFYPVNKSAGGLFWSPLSWPQHFFAQGTASELMWHLQMDEFEVHNNSLRIFLLSVQMTVTFLIITFGTRILGFVGLIYASKKMDKYLFLFLALPFILFIFIGLFFLQESGVFEGFNFIAVAAFVSVVFASILLSEIINFSKKTKSIFIKYVFLGFVVLTVMATVPRTLHDSLNYVRLYRLKSGQMLSWKQIGMFEEIGRRVPRSNLVVTDVGDQLGNYSPYVAAFSGSRMFFSGEGVLKAHGLDVSEKSAQVKKLFDATEASSFSESASGLGVNYLYLKKPVGEFFEQVDFFDTILESEESVLIQIKSS
jgi:hypothetical protein